MKQAELVIIGGGPAGLCAAISAAKSGAKVLILERNKYLGGQLVKQTHMFFGSEKQYASTRGIDIPEILLSELEKYKESIEILKRPYIKSRYKVIIVSANTKEGMDELEDLLSNKTTVVAGPSGVGKSSLINILVPGANMEVGDISKKLRRGKHTTRHSEIFYVKNNTYIIDTPGFSSLDINDIEREELKEYFPEFIEHNDKCRFVGCLHLKEPDCAVKNALSEGKISEARYESYKSNLEYIDNLQKY